MNLFRRAETLTLGDSLPWDAVLAALPFNADGLLPAIAQQADSGEVLMLAWMNREAILETLSSGRVCYWSRSRQTLWRKGETSGHQQTLKELRIDCDGDTLLLLVDQQGPACHTRRASCFYHAVRGEQVVVISEPQRIDESRFNQP
jgi:phosphoribosyl-AMP cyclohydrolase